MMISNRKLSYSIFALFSMFLMSCGGGPSGKVEPTKPPAPTPTPVVGEGKHVLLYLFSAPWCAECNRDLPEIKRRYAELTEVEQKRTEVFVHVVTGKTPGQVATQEVAEQYGKDMNLSFKMVADKNYKIYRSFFEEGHSIPASVILDQEKKTMKKYEPGTVDLNDMFNTLKANLK